MEKPIHLNIPITISYAALEGLLKQQLVGTYIPRPEEGMVANPYARISDVGVAGSAKGAYNLLLRVQLNILRTVLKRDKVDLYASVALAYDNASQQLFVQRFSMEANTSSSFYNTALEVLVNKVAYSQIIQKTRIDLSGIVAAELSKVNSQLEQGLELKGLELKGAVEAVAVQDIVPKAAGLSLRLLAQGNLEVTIYDLASLMPPKAD
ncbi:DUF4403 family protein [Pontibacter akesuensis]|uniref:DUF4403 family protein n=1 Tax=Pontibacter akesuensis TaxID=388950 RepID=A0A1I7KSQ1_9BACT|nr:DUF4403 family protein [Pontibacter akesuensis]GHA80917.1 hypothetical protein GCM10007389_39280 [Pontibacter akesuensis]SFV00408.1 protein of unknown function [Pontibacter akesuensis]